MRRILATQWKWSPTHKKHTFSELRLECWRLKTLKMERKNSKKNKTWKYKRKKNSRNKQVHKFNFRNYYYVNSRNETKKKWEKNYNPWKKEENSIKFWDEKFETLFKMRFLMKMGKWWEKTFLDYFRICEKFEYQIFFLIENFFKLSE